MSHGRVGAFVSAFQDCPRMLPVLSDLPEVSYFPCCQLIQVGLRKTGWTGLNLKSVEMHVNLVSVGLPRQTRAPELRAVQQLRFWSDHESPLPVWDCQGHLPLLFWHWGWTTLVMLPGSWSRSLSGSGSTRLPSEALSELAG